MIPCFLSSFARHHNCLNCILAAEINFYWVINKPRTKHNGYEAGRIPFISHCCCDYSHLQCIINKNVCSYNIRTMSRHLHNVTEYEQTWIVHGFYSGYLHIKEIWIAMNIHGGTRIYRLDRRQIQDTRCMCCQSYWNNALGYF